MSSLPNYMASYPRWPWYWSSDISVYGTGWRTRVQDSKSNVDFSMSCSYSFLQQSQNLWKWGIPGLHNGLVSALCCITSEPVINLLVTLSLEINWILIFAVFWDVKPGRSVWKFHLTWCWRWQDYLKCWYMGFALFWDVTQNMVVIPYRHLGTAILEFMTLEDGTSQKSANLIYFEVEAWNHVCWYMSFSYIALS